MSIYFPDQGFHQGYRHIVGPENSPLKFISFGRLQLTAEGQPYKGHSGGNEVVLDILTGLADVTVTSGGRTHHFERIGGRESVLDGRPTLVVIPPQSEYSVKAVSAMLDIAVSAAPAPIGGEPAVIGPNDSGTRLVGKGNYQREVHEGTVGTGKAARLMVGETVGKGGSWSSYPPHKHDEARPGEVPQEEVYFYRVIPQQGFGVQVLYDAPGRPDGRDAAFMIHDGDTMVLDHGYHPVVSAPGYRVFYVWALYAEADVYGAWTDDPRHAWVKEA